MSIDLIILVMLIVMIGWNILLTYWYFNSVKHYKKLQLTEGDTFREVFDKIFNNIAQLHAKHNSAAEILSSLKKQTALSLQNMGLKRFNPFGDTGSDQSFSLAMLDEHGSGIVLSSLHGRNGTRIYAKPIQDGKAPAHELSKEEQEVIDLALKK